MKNVKKICAQGDVIFRKVEALPVEVNEAKDLVVAHSESSHHHVAVGNVKRFTTNDITLGYLKASGNVKIEHLKDSKDAHETINLLGDGEGETIWEVRRMREFSPDGWRVALD